MSDEEEIVNRRGEDDSIGNRRNSRRTFSTVKEQRKSALEELKNARSSGKAYRRNTDNLIKDVYDLVTEEEYEKIQRQRAHENFVENDDGTGYFDNGTEDDFCEDEEDYDKPSTSKDDRKARAAEKKKNKEGIFKFLTPNVKSKDKASDNTPCNIEDDHDVQNMLDQLDQDNFEGFQSKPDPSFNSNAFSFANALKRPASADLAEEVPSKIPKLPSSEFLDEELAQTFEELTNSIAFDQESPAQAKVFHKELSAKVWPKIEVSTEGLPNETMNFDEEINQDTSNFPEGLVFDEELSPTRSESDLNENTLRMFWIETFEDVYKNPGSVYLFGKVGRKSCCVVVKNIEHKVYFLPRNFSDENKQNLVEVHAEVQDKFLNNKFFQTSGAKDKVFRAKPENIKWVPNDEKTPREVQALMVLYKGYLPKIPPQTTGDSFSQVLNTTATAMERLLLETKLRGPCWIDINNAVESKKKLSHCDLEYLVDMKSSGEYNIKPADVKKPSPFVNLLSLNIVAVPSSGGNETQIIMISGLFRSNGLLDRANSSSQDAYETFCFLTNPTKGILPLTFDAELKRAGLSQDSVKKMTNERVLLNSFFAKLKQLDPDVIISHDASAQISLLISRAEKYSIKTWSFISRLNRHQAPSRLCKTKAGQWELMAGRSLLCSKTAAEELYPTRSYELGELVSLLIPNASRAQLTFAQIIEPFMGSKPSLSVSQLIQWSWLEAFYQLLIVLQLSALPLFVQITQIVGGVLSRTLLGGRAERNEFLLLHAFCESGYIPPDKHQFSAKKENKALKNEPNDEEDTKVVTGRKAQYTGGLVLEPKKGFYDSYIVLLDFNSLYPSIIQEFNICFTTIDRCYEEPNEKGLPDPPKEAVPEGILSVEIGNLVRNRREVKAQMKNAKPGTDEYLRLDVRQKGLKLTANSMYGCLGFGMSRFCAKTLAAMITSKGRELLSRTKEMVEKRGYTVVYGDTDSIMVNTNTSVYNEACRLAYDLRRIVNGGFKHVEMDVDGLFKRLLLLKKKKYAALTVSLNSETNVKKEMKGLDIVRRDWSKLAKDVGEKVVDLILNSTEREELVNDVVSTLEELVENLKANKLPMEDFEILKQLTKSPKEYTDVKNQPHVMVASRLNNLKGQNLHQGDVIKYVICQDGTSNSAVQRAYHLSELDGNENLSIDTHYYLAHQVHPVIMRLCDPFQELDPCRIAEALGLDPVGYRGNSMPQSVDYNTFDSTSNAFADFDVCEGFQFECPECKKPVIIRSTFQGQALNVYFSIEKCPECKCKLIDHYDALRSSFLIQLNGFIKKYSTAEFVCEDQTCAYLETDLAELTWTSSQGPLCPQCKSSFMRKQFSLRDLFFQQKFFKRIFDWKPFMEKHCSGEQQKLLKGNGTYAHVTKMYDDFENLTLDHMKNNRYNRVDLGRILSGFKRVF